jgi:hypothetical protein
MFGRIKSTALKLLVTFCCGITNSYKKRLKPWKSSDFRGFVLQKILKKGNNILTGTTKGKTAFCASIQSKRNVLINWQSVLIFG